MAKKKKKNKSDKLPYVHIDVLAEEEQLPYAALDPQPSDQVQIQELSLEPVQQESDATQAQEAEGFEWYPSEVVSASEDGLFKQRLDGRSPVAYGKAPEVTSQASAPIEEVSPLAEEGLSGDGHGPIDHRESAAPEDLGPNLAEAVLIPEEEEQGTAVQPVLETDQAPTEGAEAPQQDDEAPVQDVRPQPEDRPPLEGDGVPGANPQQSHVEAQAAPSGSQMPTPYGQMPSANAQMPAQNANVPASYGPSQASGGMQPQPQSGPMPTAHGQSAMPNGQLPIVSGQVPLAYVQAPMISGQLPLVYGQMPMQNGQVPAQGGQQMPMQNGQMPAQSGQPMPMQNGQMPAQSGQPMPMQNGQMPLPGIQQASMQGEPPVGAQGAQQASPSNDQAQGAEGEVSVAADPVPDGNGQSSALQDEAPATEEHASKSEEEPSTEAGADAGIAPFVIPVFRKASASTQGGANQPAQSMQSDPDRSSPAEEGKSQENAVGSAPSDQQIPTDALDAAAQSAEQQPTEQQAAEQQPAQQISLQTGQQVPQQAVQQAVQQAGQQPIQQPVQQMGQQPMQASVSQNSGQFAPVTGQMAVPQQAYPQAQHPAGQNPQALSQMGHSARRQSTQAVPKAAMQQAAAAATAAAVRVAQSRAAAQAAIRAAQAQRAAKRHVNPNVVPQVASGATSRHRIPGSGAAFQQQGIGAAARRSAQAQLAQANHAKAAAMAHYQAAKAQEALEKDALDAAKDAKQKDKLAGDKTGEPILDPKAAEESTLFDEAPEPLEEKMRKSTSGRKRGKRALIIIAILVLLAAGGAAAYLSLSEQGVVPRISIETSTISVLPQESTGSGNAGADAAPGSNDGGATNETPSGSDLSGTVVYEYTANTASGVEYKVKETVTFQPNGDCQSSTMDMTFPDAASAKTFTDNLARDYGTSFKLDSLDGDNAVVTIDNSGLHLTRDEYENALRYSVSDLVVSK